MRITHEILDLQPPLKYQEMRWAQPMYHSPRQLWTGTQCKSARGMSHAFTLPLVSNTQRRYTAPSQSVSLCRGLSPSSNAAKSATIHHAHTEFISGPASCLCSPQPPHLSTSRGNGWSLTRNAPMTSIPALPTNGSSHSNHRNLLQVPKLIKLHPFQECCSSFSLHLG